MTTPRPVVLGLPLLAILAGCTITQNARPVSLRADDARQLCIVEDPRVNGSFLLAYTTALQGKGLSVKLLPASSAVTSCPLTSTYYARWSSDFVTYMSHATVFVFRDGTRVGDALYDAPKAGLGLTTRIYESTDSKVATMVDQLFPPSE